MGHAEQNRHFKTCTHNLWSTFKTIEKSTTPVSCARLHLETRLEFKIVSWEYILDLKPAASFRDILAAASPVFLVFSNARYIVCSLENVYYPYCDRKTQKQLLRAGLGACGFQYGRNSLQFPPLMNFTVRTKINSYLPIWTHCWNPGMLVSILPSVIKYSAVHCSIYCVKEGWQ